MLKQLKYLFILIFILPALIGCTTEISPLTLTPSPTWHSTPTTKPFLTQTATITPARLNLDETLHLTPSPTPVIHTVQRNDTLIGIANRYGVEVDKIISANPDINPNILQIGMTLTIPMGEVIVHGVPSPTPLPLIINRASCYRINAPNGIMCFIPVQNNLNKAVFNITAQVVVYDEDNKKTYKTFASTPINILQPQTTIPLVTRFYEIGENISAINVELLSALPVPQSENRPPPLEILELKKNISQNKIIAKITGTISRQNKQNQMNKIVLVAFAYNEKHNPVGYRKQIIEINDNSPIEIPFSIQVYSLGDPITDIEVFAENATEQ